jgi:hypothetical protein
MALGREWEANASNQQGINASHLILEDSKSQTISGRYV